MSGGYDSKSQGAAETKSSREMGTWAQGAPHPPDPRVGQAGLGSRLPRTSEPPPSRSRGVPTHQGQELRGRPARVSAYALRQEAEAGAQRSARPGQGGTARDRAAPAPGPKGRGTRAEPRRAVQRVGSAPALRSRGCGGPGSLEVGGGGGIPSGMPPASPAPSPGSAAAWEKGRCLFGEGGDPGVGGVVGLSLV